MSARRTDVEPRAWLEQRLVPSIKDVLDRAHRSDTSGHDLHRFVDGAVRVVVDDVGPVLLELRDGAIAVVEDTAQPIRAAIGLDRSTFDFTVALAESSGWLTPERLSQVIEKALSAELEHALGGGSLDFHVCIERDEGPVVFRVGLNRADPPDRPTFTVSMTESDLAALERDVKSAFLEGNVRLEGDYARALQIALATGDD